MTNTTPSKTPVYLHACGTCTRYVPVSDAAHRDDPDALVACRDCAKWHNRRARDYRKAFDLNLSGATR